MRQAKAAGGRPTKDRVAKINRDVIAATIEAYAKHGHDFHIDAVAKTAGVSKQAIYRRWPTKMALLVEAVEQRLLTEASRHSESPPAQPLAFLRGKAWEIYTADHLFRSRLAINIREDALAEPGLRMRLGEWTRLLEAPIAAAIGELSDCRDLPVETINRRALMFSDVFSAAGFRDSLDGEQSESERERLFELAWKGFAPLLDA